MFSKTYVQKVSFHFHQIFVIFIILNNDDVLDKFLEYLTIHVHVKYK